MNICAETGDFPYKVPDLFKTGQWPVFVVL